MSKPKGFLLIDDVPQKTNGTKFIKETAKFKLSFEEKLDNGYELKDLKHNQPEEFHRFVAETVYKGLTISKVDELFLRKSGDAPRIKRGDNDLLHYGKAGNPFRLFGYYNTDGYFVVCRIDAGHNTHKRK